MARTRQPIRKIALGLFHFNLHYIAGDVSSYHRYCTQAVMPFLRLVAGDPEIRVSFEMAGSGLEFLGNFYPEALDLLRRLIASGQIELISATYVPTLWVAFPGRDLLKSIELNRSCLERLQLRASELFFAQEAFFGAGLQEVAPHFRAVLCKDEYIRYHRNSAAISGLYSLGSLSVVVGANHLINELARDMIRGGPAASASGPHQLRIAAALSTLPNSPAESIVGRRGNVEWYWYHMGSGHHFSTSAAPADWERFFYDEEWASLNLATMRRVRAQGYAFGTISELLSATRADYPPLPRVIEAGWNTARSRGVFTWMGRHDNSWDNNTALQGLAWRSRTALRKCEESLQTLPAASSLHTEKLAAAWKHQLFAESSDAYGWKPLAGEVSFGRENAEEALRLANALAIESVGDASIAGVVETHETTVPLDTKSRSKLPKTELFGAEGSVTWRRLSSGVFQCDVEFVVTANEAGVNFARTGTAVTYCPSGLEAQPVTFREKEIGAETFYLPLANGLIGLGSNRFLIRLNQWGQPAARIQKNFPTLAFGIAGQIISRTIHWRFLLVFGNQKTAVARANRANSI